MLDILYEEGPCFVVRKPGGLLTQAPPDIDSLESRVKAFLKERDQKSGRIYLGVPHRLDRPASGLLVMARHVRAARRLSEQFEGRLVRKTYWAVIEGHLNDDKGEWQDTLRKIPGQPVAELVDSDHPEGRSARLRYRLIARLPKTSWLEIELETGRYHQIRVQAASRGYPLLGDSQYGATLPFGPVTEDPRARWIALHARQLGFHHPMSREAVSVTAPLYPWWEELGLPLDQA